MMRNTALTVMALLFGSGGLVMSSQSRACDADTSLVLLPTQYVVINGMCSKQVRFCVVGDTLLLANDDVVFDALAHRRIAPPSAEDIKLWSAAPFFQSLVRRGMTNDEAYRRSIKRDVELFRELSDAYFAGREKSLARRTEQIRDLMTARGFWDIIKGIEAAHDGWLVTKYASPTPGPIRVLPGYAIGDKQAEVPTATHVYRSLLAFLSRRGPRLVLFEGGGRLMMEGQEVEVCMQAIASGVSTPPAGCQPMWGRIREVCP